MRNTVRSASSALTPSTPRWYSTPKAGIHGTRSTSWYSAPPGVTSHQSWIVIARWITVIASVACRIAVRFEPGIPATSAMPTRGRNRIAVSQGKSLIGSPEQVVGQNRDGAAEEDEQVRGYGTRLPPARDAAPKPDEPRRPLDREAVD